MSVSKENTYTTHRCTVTNTVNGFQNEQSKETSIC